MANEIFESIWKIMKENKFQLINEINNDLICNICGKLMVEPCNTPCGCKYCSRCLVNYLDGKDKFCPGKDQFCQMKMINFEKDVVINYPVNIKITGIMVKCPNKNCEFTDKLCFIENHMKKCDKNETSCPYFQIGCKNDDLINNEMKDHLCTEIYCHTKLLLDFINNLQNEIELMRNDIVELKSENKNLKNELDKINVESKNNQMKNEDFESKIKNNLSEIEEKFAMKNENRLLMDKLENIDKTRINEVIERMQKELEQQTREIDEMKGKCEHTENKEIEMKRIIDEIVDKNADLMKSNNYDEKINNLQIKLIEIERITEKMNFGEFEWKIENFSQQQRRTRIFSETFYSHKYGYKMGLSMWIGGDCDYIDFHLMRGEFDYDLLWPFKHVITVDIINQMNGGVISSKSIKYDDYQHKHYLNKPTTERNDGVCFHQIKKPEEIIRNNQFLIKCKINI